MGAYFNQLDIPIHNEAQLIAVLRQGAFTPVECPERVGPALADRAERIKIGLRKSVRLGITEPEAVYKRLGDARRRIQEMLPEIIAEVGQNQ